MAKAGRLDESELTLSELVAVPEDDRFISGLRIAQGPIARYLGRVFPQYVRDNFGGNPILL